MVNFLLGLLVGVIGLLWMWQRYQRVRSQWQKRLQQSEETTQSYHQERDALIRQYQELTQRLQALDETYQAAVQRIQELEQENQHYKQQVQRLETDHRIAIQRVQVLEAENQQLQTDCTDFQKYAQAIEATHQQTQVDYQDAINQIQVLETEKRQLQQRVDQLLECINQHADQRPIVSAGTQTNSHVAVIFEATEQDLYPDEIYDTILSILRIYADSLPEEYRRRHHILQDILNCNPPSGCRDELQQTIKSLFANYQGKTERLVRDLVDLGFEFLDSPNHYKVKWYGDDRYVFSFAKTPSDYRAGANIARDLIRLLF